MVKMKLKKIPIFSLIVVALLITMLFYKESSFISESIFFSGFDLLNEYVREHILFCLLPAFFIAGAISVFVKKSAILKYLGDEAKKPVSYSIASVSGSVLAVCSCTILPMFAGIRKRGAGLGPATTFLFSGPAINIAAIFLTISVLGLEIGLARIIAAILIAILVGVSMQAIFREKVEEKKIFLEEENEEGVSKNIVIVFFLSMVGVLVVNGLQIDQTLKYVITALLVLVVVGIAVVKFEKKTRNAWLLETWNFTKMLMPYLIIGVFIIGTITPFIPQEMIESLVGSNTIMGNFIASVFGAIMYFSTLTEIPIIQALTENGMYKGPVLALLLAGPSVSLPNMLVIKRVLGNLKTGVYILLVVLYSTLAGLIFGSLF